MGGFLHSPQGRQRRAAPNTAVGAEEGIDAGLAEVPHPKAAHHGMHLRVGVDVQHALGAGWRLCIQSVAFA